MTVGGGGGGQTGVVGRVPCRCTAEGRGVAEAASNAARPGSGGSCSRGCDKRVLEDLDQTSSSSSRNARRQGSAAGAGGERM